MVMSVAIKHDYIALDDYLAGERDVDVRSEYINGQVYAMAGASETHNTICAELFVALYGHLPADCRAWQSDMKLQSENKGKQFVYYPDIMVACGENDDDPYVRTNPLLLVEVLSPSTQRTDLVEKLENYSVIPSLMEYLVVAQDVPLVRLYRRRTAWQMETYYAEDSVELESLKMTLPVETIYQRVRKSVGLPV